MQTAKLVYYTDALCGWCYGFSPVMRKIQEEYRNKIDIDVVSGGLFLNDRVGPIDKVAPYIKTGAYQKVEQATGVEFGNGFLNQKDMVLNSLPPAIALCIVKESVPEKALDFVELLLAANYDHGMNPDDSKAYEKYAIQIGIDAQEFNIKMRNSIYAQKALEDFERYRSEGIQGYPSLVLETENKKYHLTTGFMPYEELKPLLEQYLV